jgi:hypothetical protein
MESYKPQKQQIKNTPSVFCPIFFRYSKTNKRKKELFKRTDNALKPPSQFDSKVSPTFATQDFLIRIKADER